ncbi:hypothetical protein FACS1894116_08410 [Betaproteobacteria bacterium]|nr:hypothetical protein FACS1894116_08410 [Betaproteobacteria bacterium]GHT97742.1 hypothetical protein FACS1894154_01790 [Betaproteobacteria bacterium]GHU22274.1 hypothetical protein FACS189488_02490 [Betaproteobacteria bacterium]
MDETRYKLVFDGQVAPETSTETVKANLAHLFKCDLSRIEPLFSGKPVTLKRGLSGQEAQRYVQALRAAGAEVRMERELPTEADAAPVRAERRSGFSAKNIAYCALVLWLVSLPLTVFSSFYGDELRGISILLFGWLGVLLPNIAWFSNAFFLYAFVKIQHGKPVFWSVISAITLSFTSFNAPLMPTLWAWDIHPIDAYGWGFVLWLLSLFMLAIAAGTQWVKDEYDDDYEFGEMKYAAGRRLKPLGIVLVISTLCLSVFFAVHDRIQGNSEEKSLLHGVAFTRGPVCTIAPPPSFSQPLISGSGPVEIRMVSAPRLHSEPEYVYRLKKTGDYYKQGYFLSDPFQDKRVLLSWGIPVIRIEDKDFSYIKLGDEWILTSTPADSPASAIISINDKAISLLEGKTERVLFEQTWTWVGETGVTRILDKFCPQSFDFTPKENEQPRKFIVEALGVHQTEEHKQQLNDNKAENVKIEIVSDEPINSSLFHYPEHKDLGNKNCTNDVKHEYNIFRIGSREFYYHGFRNWGVCTTSHVYLMHTKDQGTGSNLKMEIEVEKREMPSFRRVWAGTVTINGVSKLEDVDVDDDDQSLFTLTLSNGRKDGDKTLKKVKLKAQDESSLNPPNGQL